MKLAVPFMGACLCMLVSCHKGIIGDPDYRNEKPSIDAVSYTPQYVLAGDIVLIDYSIGTDIFYDDGIYTDDLPGAVIGSSAGEIVPLKPAIYRTGDPLPSFDDALAANAPAEHYLLIQEGHVFMLFKAPETPQLVTIEYWLGGPRPHSSRGHHELVLEVH